MFEKGQKHELQFERIVFFSDALFAIAITLLIIEIKVPHLEHDTASPRDFIIALARLIPNFIGYFFSFLVIGAYWVGHHKVYGMIVDWNYGLIWRNVFFLMTIAFMPFASAFFSEYFTELVPLIVYALTFSLAGILEIVQFRYAFRNGLMDPDAKAEDVSHIAWRMAVLHVAGLVAIAIAVIAKPMFAGFAFMLIPVAHQVIKRKFGKSTEREVDTE
ncbi:MAG: DUF1211 domain-containing protein [Chloracidobacterium sp.]|nr:DUF1211 domain-containing protein [Chloracidobacterium sp.]